MTTVRHSVALHCDDEQDRPMAFMASFTYVSDDPYAVVITFHVPAGDVDWVVDRALLQRGMAEPAGDGDIRLWPGVDEAGRAIVLMDFHSPDGRILVEARVAEVLAFLAETWAVVAPGAESALVDLDELVLSLLD